MVSDEYRRIYSMIRYQLFLAKQNLIQVTDC